MADETQQQQDAPDPNEPEGYAEWFQKQVDEGLAYIARPDAVFYTHEEVFDGLAERRAEWLRRARKSA